jgi:hypothetical protein
MTGHQNRVATLAVPIANKMDLADNRIEGINIAGLVDDIGMNYFPTEILNRPAPLTNEERLMVQEHPTIGYKIMSTVDFDWPIAEIIMVVLTKGFKKTIQNIYQPKIKVFCFYRKSRIINRNFVFPKHYNMEK